MIETILSRLGSISINQFLQDYWQKKPLVIRNALADFPVLDPDELAGYSLEDGVESRLILEKVGTKLPSRSQWRMEEGPFSADRFSQLPATHWTLLVQAVDQLNPELHQLLHRFRFIPNWRVDDLMVSYAVDGGGVGPHFDYYDVFLLQASGSRHWRLGRECDAGSRLRQDTSCKILAEFDTTEEWTLHPGDLLYIPPRIAHWGVAQGECMTYSTGFRAPSYAEMLLDCSQEIASVYTEDQRFSDPGRERAANPGLISDADLTSVIHQLRDMVANEAQIADWFGRYMTQPQRDTLSYQEENPIPRLAPKIRAAYRRGGPDLATLYINGDQFTASLALAENICSYAPINASHYPPAERQLIEELTDCGYLQ